MPDNISVLPSDDLQPGPNCPSAWLGGKESHLKAIHIGSTTNSSYECPAVPLEGIKVWENFLDRDSVNEIRDFLLKNPLIHRRLCEDFTDQQLKEFPWGPSVQGPIINEQSFERQWSPIITGINIIVGICHKAMQSQADPIYCIIGDGGAARKKEPDAPKQTYRKKPDLSTFETQPPSKKFKPDEINNRIPGDAKLSAKISRAMLPPDGERWLAMKYNEKDEVQKVMNQIYDYMDQHGARYGYVVNDEELIFFRRRGTGWGHMDVGPAIRHDVDADLERAIMTPKYVLFYFLMAIAPYKDKWHLPSNRKDVQHRRNARRSVRTKVK